MVNRMSTSTAATERVAELAHRVIAAHDPKQVPVTELLGACYDAGLAWVNFPEGLGGLGLSRGLQSVADAVLHCSTSRSTAAITGAPPVRARRRPVAPVTSG